VKGRPRLSRFVGLALLAHAAAAAWVSRTALSARVVPQGAETELRVDIEPAETTAPETAPPEMPPATPPATEPPTASNAAAEPHVAASLRSATLANPAPAPQGEPSTEGAPAPADSTSGGWTLSPFASQGTVRSGAAPAGSAFDEAVRAGVRATVAEATKRRDPLKHLLGGYSARDLELGLIPGSEYVALTRDGVRSSRAPNVGHATFEITVDGGGNLTAVRILDASSNRFEWDEAAQEIMKAAHGQRTRVPSGSQGVVLTLEVSSDLRTTSGLPPATTAFGRITRAISDPLDAVVDGTVPLQRVIAARVLDVTVL
jgi:TonB family protein